MEEENKSLSTSGCQVCGANAPWQCSSCKMAWYCGRDHQIADLKKHKLFCKSFQQKTTKKKGICQVCDAPSPLQCSSCMKVWYCGREHQKADWENHKQSCKEVQRKEEEIKKRWEEETKPIDDGVFRVGDRVVLHGLQNAHMLNERYGRVFSEIDANGRHQVILDLMSDPEINPKVKTRNIRRSFKVINKEKRVEAKDGVLFEKESAWAIINLFDILKICAANYVPVNRRMVHTGEIVEIHVTDDFAENQCRIAAAWRFWNTNTPGPSKTIYEHVKYQLQHNRSINNPTDLIRQRIFGKMTESMDNDLATKSWHLRIHGTFWIVGMDDDGTYVVADDDNRDFLKVYQALGSARALWKYNPKLDEGRPYRAILTLVPWYGRLVSDGCISIQAGFGVPVVATKPQMATLRRAVSAAKRDGRVIQGLAQLEE